jgi:hypothetical protein
MNDAVLSLADGAEATVCEVEGGRRCQSPSRGTNADRRASYVFKIRDTLSLILQPSRTWKTRHSRLFPLPRRAPHLQLSKAHPHPQTPSLRSAPHHRSLLLATPRATLRPSSPLVPRPHQGVLTSPLWTPRRVKTCAHHPGPTRRAAAPGRLLRLPVYPTTARNRTSASTSERSRRLTLLL